MKMTMMIMSEEGISKATRGNLILSTFQKLATPCKLKINITTSSQFKFYVDKK